MKDKKTIWHFCGALPKECRDVVTRVQAELTLKTGKRPTHCDVVAWIIKSYK